MPKLEDYLETFKEEYLSFRRSSNLFLTLCYSTTILKYCLSEAEIEFVTQLLIEGKAFENESSCLYVIASLRRWTRGSLGTFFYIALIF